MALRTCWNLLRMTALLSIALLVTLSPGPGVSANGAVAIFDQNPEGVSAEVWASGAIDPLGEGMVLGLERMALDACSAVALDGAAGPALIVAESSAVEVTTVMRGAVVHTTLAQGQSTVMPAGQGFRLSNGASDPAFTATALILYATDNADQPMGRVQPQSGEAYVEWADGSACDTIQGATTVSMFVWGGAAAGATQLWVGSAAWAPGATTEGWAITDRTATFDAVLLSGGMDNAGAGTGRAFHAGPYRPELGPWQAMSDFAVAEPVGMHAPFANTGLAPVTALVFGTASRQGPVYTMTGSHSLS